MSEGESKTSSCLKVLGIGCVILIVLTVLAVGAGVYFIKVRGLELTASAITAITDGILKEARLSEEDKAGVRGEIARFTSQLEAGGVSMEQVKKLMDTFQRGPLPTLLFLQAVATGNLVPPGIPEEEAAAARLNAQRLQRAAAEGKVTVQALQEVLKAIPHREGGKPQAESEPVDFTPRSEEEITPEDWRPVMAVIKKMADEAGIPDEPYQLELTQEIRKMLDQVLSSSS